MHDRCIVEVTDRLTLEVQGCACGRYDRREQLEALALRHLERHGELTCEPLTALDDAVWINVYREKR